MGRLRLFLILLPLFSTLILSCSSWASIEYEKHELPELFSIELPNYLFATDELNKEADFQFQNTSKNLCLIIRKNEWKDLKLRRPEFVLEDFYDVSIEQLKGNLERIDAPAPDSISLNGLPAFLGSLSGTFKGDRLVFDICTIAGRRHLYQLVIWTSLVERDQYQADIQKIIQSFEEKEVLIQNEEIRSDLLLQP